MFFEGVGVTLLLAVVGTLLGLLIGIGLALLRNLKTTPKDNVFVKCIKKFFSFISLVYIQVFRGTPMMVQAMIIYFGGQLLGFPWNSIESGKIFIEGHLICGLVVISINTAAYMAEIIRSGINAIDNGQIEGARSLGMNYFQTMIHIVIPQALKNSIPTIGNEFIVNIKDSSVLNVISVTELYMTVSIATTKNSFKVGGYVIIACIYLVLTLIVSQILKVVEKYLEDPESIKFWKRFKKGEVKNV